MIWLMMVPQLMVPPCTHLVFPKACNYFLTFEKRTVYKQEKYEVYYHKNISKNWLIIKGFMTHFDVELSQTLMQLSNNYVTGSLYQSINQTSTAPISPAKPGSVARQPNQCPTANRGNSSVTSTGHITWWSRKCKAHFKKPVDCLKMQ